jgi:hypothetical protein
MRIFLHSIQRLALALGCLCFPWPGYSGSTFDAIDQPPHDYWTRPLKDPFTAFKQGLESGDVRLDPTNELAFLSGVLKVLKIPVSSQMLVFSTTSLQLSLISPSNPRAIYFNEDVYIGFIPRGKIEVVSLDPDLG